MINIKISKQTIIASAITLVVGVGVASAYWYLNPKIVIKEAPTKTDIDRNESGYRRVVSEVKGVYRITTTRDPDFYQLDNLRDRFNVFVPSSWDVNTNGAGANIKENAGRLYNSDLSGFSVSFVPYNKINVEVNTKSFKQSDMLKNFDEWLKYKDEYQNAEFINPEGMGSPINFKDHLTVYKGFNALSFVPVYNKDYDTYIDSVIIPYYFDFKGEKLGSVEFYFSDDVYSKENPTPIPLKNQDFTQDKLFNKINDSLIFY